MLALPGLRMPFLRTCHQRHSLHRPQLSYLRSLKLPNPHPGDIRPGWDLEPLLRCLKDDAGGYRPPSGPRHQARGSLRDLSPRRHLLLLMRVHRPSYHRPREQAPMFNSDPIPRNVDLRARDFHGDPYYDIPVLTVDHQFRDSMWLIRQHSMLPFMTSRQFYYPRVVLQFYHSMTSCGVPSPLVLRFSIDGRPRVLRAADITAALGLPAALANSTGYREWPEPSHREMVRCLARDTTAGPILFHR